MLDIEPIKDDGLNGCLHFLIVSVANWLNCGFELMYADAWGFKFAPEGTKGEGIWARGDLGPRIYYGKSNNSMEFLRKFHGLQVNYVKNDDMNEVYHTLGSELSNKSPIIIWMDTYYLPWLDNFYHKIHSIHTILVIGIDDNGALLCNDTRPYFQSPVHGGKLTKENFNSGYKGSYSVFRIVNPEDGFDYPNIFKQTAFRMLDKSNSLSAFDSMRDFGKYIKLNSIQFIDLEDFDGGYGILIRGIRNIIRDRKNFSDALKFAGNKYQVAKYLEFHKEFKLPIGNWENLKTILYKAYVDQTIDSKRDKIAAMILETADSEENIATELYHLAG